MAVFVFIFIHHNVIAPLHVLCKYCYSGLTMVIERERPMGSMLGDRVGIQMGV